MVKKKAFTFGSGRSNFGSDRGKAFVSKTKVVKDFVSSKLRKKK